MAANDDIYLGRYEGWYSVRDEAFYDESELVDGEGGQRVSPQGTPVEWTVEESWFFRLSKYQQVLLDLYESNPEFIQPDSRRNEILSFVRGGLSDLSISRSSFDWGVPVPDSPGHVMYVWVDALTNYLTGLGYPAEGALDRYWPADLHLIGKDIVRFHTVYWPAFLISAGLPVPKQVFGHGFLLNRGEKMSKSVGNVVDPLEMASLYGVDQLRYFLMREVSFGQDGSYSHEDIVTRCNAELANSFGNLAQRVLSMVFKNLKGELSTDWEVTEADQRLQDQVLSACRDELPAAFEELAFSTGIEAWMRAVFACNQYIDEQAPWTLRKTDPARMVAVLNNLVICIRSLGLAIAPVVPASAAKLLDQLGIPEEERSFAALADDQWFARLVASGFTLSQPVGIFPRLEMDVAAAD